MKAVIIIGLLLASLQVLSQDSTLVANTKLIEIATETKSLREQVSHLTTKLDLYESLAKETQDQIKQYATLKIEDDKIISLMQTELQLRTNLYSEMMSDAYKPKNKGAKDLIFFSLGLVMATLIAVTTN